MAGANTFSKPVWLFCPSWTKDLIKLSITIPAEPGRTPHIQAHLPAIHFKHRQPVHREICNPSSLEEPECTSQVQDDTCMLLTGKRGSGYAMRAGAWSLLIPPGKWSVSQSGNLEFNWLKHKDFKGCTLRRLPPIEIKKIIKMSTTPKISSLHTKSS